MSPPFRRGVLAALALVVLSCSHQRQPTPRTQPDTLQKPWLPFKTCDAQGETVTCSLGDFNAGIRLSFDLYHAARNLEVDLAKSERQKNSSIKTKDAQIEVVTMERDQAKDSRFKFFGLGALAGVGMSLLIGVGFLLTGGA